MKFDLGGLLQSAKSMAMVPLFLALFLVVRGLPVLFYRKDLAKDERLPFALCAAAALPMVVAITEIGVKTGACIRTSSPPSGLLCSPFSCLQSGGLAVEECAFAPGVLDWAGCVSHSNVRTQSVA